MDEKRSSQYVVCVKYKHRYHGIRGALLCNSESSSGLSRRGRRDIMMQYLLLSVAVAVWCLIGLLLVVGIREIIKLQPRTKARRSKTPEQNTRGVDKNAAIRIYYLTASSGFSGMGTTTDVARRTWEHRATRLRQHVERRAFDKDTRMEQRRRPYQVRSNDWMKKHDEIFPVADEA